MRKYLMYFVLISLCSCKTLNQNISTCSEDCCLLNLMIEDEKINRYMQFSDRAKKDIVLFENRGYFVNCTELNAFGRQMKLLHEYPLGSRSDATYIAINQVVRENDTISITLYDPTSGYYAAATFKKNKRGYTISNRKLEVVEER